MKEFHLLPIGALLVLALALPACEASPPEAPAEAGVSGIPASVDVGALADQLVGEDASVQEGDLVLITGSSRDERLLEELAVQVRRRGAFPMISLTNDRLAYRLVAEVPEAFDSQEPALDMAAAGLFDVMMEIESNESADPLAGISPARLTTIAEAALPVTTALAENGVRRVYIGNELYPIQAVADHMGVSLDELRSMFWQALLISPSELAAAAAPVKETLEGGTELRITHPNGTDLTMRIAGRPVYVSDGAISPEDQATGGAALSVWLPAGEVFLAPVPGTASGQVVVDRDFWEGQEIRSLRMTFEDGRLTSIAADSGLEKLQEDYAVGGEGKDVFAVVDIGLNPGLDQARVPNYVPAGMVTLGIGNNTWAGGENAAVFSFLPHLPGATVTVDGVPVVEGGVLR